jgi:PilZ domain-containing protein
MMNKRESRINKKLMVSFSENGYDGLGLTQNISKYGMCIASEIEIQSPREILLSIAVPGEVLNLKGEVVWCRELDGNSHNIPDQLGIKILEAPVEYINYVEFVKYQRRIPGRPVL